MAIDDKIRDEKLQYDINGETAKIRVTNEILGVPGPKTFWMPWRMIQKQISRKTSLAK